jgi:moderate conductance mechanosensitive channel
LVRWVGPLLLLAISAATPVPAAEAPSAPPAASTLAPVSPSDLRRLVATLRDPAARDRLVAELEALLAAEQAAAEKRQSAPPARPRPAIILSRFRQRLAIAGHELLAGTAVVLDAPQLIGWARQQLVDPVTRRRWIDAGYAFALVFGPALAAEAILRWILTRAVPRMPVRRSDSRRVRAFFAILAFVVDALPIAIFAAAAFAAVALIPDGLNPTRVTLSVLAEATIEARLALWLARAVLVPAKDSYLLLPADAATRNRLYLWLRRFVLAGIYGYAIPEACWWLGIPGALYALLLKAAGLVLALLAIVFVLQQRASVAARLGGAGAAGSGWDRCRRTVGEIWHLPAILYILGLYLVYALHISGGFAYVLRASVASLVIIAAARLLLRAIDRFRRGGFAVSAGLQSKFPTLKRRTDRYFPVLLGIAVAAVYGFAALAVLSAWNVPAFAWLNSGLGRIVALELLSTALILAAAIVVWEIVDSAIERYLTRLGTDAPAHRSRLPTLLPFLRTAALCVFVVLIGLTILSHLGIDIAPLLAGAGIVGVAIGFGSQTLVKDIITGLFILVEDQLAVGDVVDVGNGHSGVVEAMTIRTLQLRDQAGTVHTIPFSSVTTIKNLTKDFAYVVARITISYAEDIDRVVAILREVCDTLAEDPALQPLILDPFDYQGVDSLDELWVTLLLRIRTLPMRQWTVGRAFNRLLKIAFDEHRIATRDPNPIILASAAQSAERAPARPAAGECRRG